jgi:hypothetical protein
MYIAGHFHKGRSAFDNSNGIYHLTLPSTLNCDLINLNDNHAIF